MSGRTTKSAQGSKFSPVDLGTGTANPIEHGLQGLSLRLNDAIRLTIVQRDTGHAGEDRNVLKLMPDSGFVFARHGDHDTLVAAGPTTHDSPSSNRSWRAALLGIERSTAS